MSIELHPRTSDEESQTGPMNMETAMSEIITAERSTTMKVTKGSFTYEVHIWWGYSYRKFKKKGA